MQMGYCMVKIVTLALCLVVTACAEQEVAITSSDTSSASENSTDRVSLLNFIHNEEIGIIYRAGQANALLMEEALKVWLSALDDKDNIVHKFKIAQYVSLSFEQKKEYQIEVEPCPNYIENCYRPFYTRSALRVMNHPNRKPYINNATGYRISFIINKHTPPNQGSAHTEHAFYSLMHQIGLAFKLFEHNHFVFDQVAYQKYRTLATLPYHTVMSYPYNPSVMPYKFDDANQILSSSPLPFIDKFRLRRAYENRYEPENAHDWLFDIIKEGISYRTTIEIIREFKGIPFSEQNAFLLGALENYTDSDGNTTLHHVVASTENDSRYYHSLYYEWLYGGMKLEASVIADLKQRKNNAGQSPLDLLQEIKSDTNKDGVVNILDLVNVSKHIGKYFSWEECRKETKEECTCSVEYPSPKRVPDTCNPLYAADINDDHKINEEDLKIISSYFSSP